MSANRPELKRNHLNLWLASVFAALVHFWIAWAFIGPFPKGDLIVNSYLFTIVTPHEWAGFSIATGVAMLYGIYKGPYYVAQLSAAVGMLLALALSFNGLAEMVRIYAEGHTPPLAVKLLFGLGAFYLVGHWIFATEAPRNPASPYTRDDG